MNWRTIEHGVSRYGRPCKSIFVFPPTWDAFLTELETVAPKQEGYSQRPDSYWTGVESFEDTMKLAREGWPMGREMLMQATAQLQNLFTVGGVQPLARYAESGDEVDVGLYLEGEPEHMVEFIPRELTHGKGGKIVKILVNVTTGAWINKQTAFVRGAFALTLADILEREGYRIEFQVGELGSGAPEQIFIRTIIKQANEQMDIDRLAFAFGHPAVQRMLFFRYYEMQEPEVWSVLHRNYGGVGNFDDPDPSVIEIGSLDHNIIHSPAAAMAQYNAVFQKLGIKLETTTLEPQLQ